MASVQHVLDDFQTLPVQEHTKLHCVQDETATKQLLHKPNHQKNPILSAANVKDTLSPYMVTLTLIMAFSQNMTQSCQSTCTQVKSGTFLKRWN